LDFVIVLLSFTAAFALLLGIYYYRTRNRIEEQLNKQKAIFYVPTRIFGTKLSRYVDIDRLDGVLRLAENPWGLDGESYLGSLVVLIAGCLVVGSALSISGVFGPSIVLLLTFSGFAVPRYLTHRKADENRAMLRIHLMDFASQMEHAVAGGALPIRVVEWASEGESLFARQMRVVKEQASKNVSLHKAFTEHFAGRLEIPEAAEIGSALRNAEQRGVPISEQLREINRNFRRQRQDELYIKTSKLKTSVTVILSLIVLIACSVLIVGPVILSAIRAF
jgi:Flp pilus assembly protein TadB